MSTVELQNVTKIFDKTVKALDDISFTVKDAEFFVLLGPTGAGKTTTLRAIAGLEKVDQGKILFDQEDVTTAQPAARDTAFVFQQYSLYPHYKVFDNLAFPLRSPLRKVPEEEINSKVNKIAEMLKISNKLNNKATELSGGEMQRVAIARALVHQPVILLADEPTGNLDSENGRKIIELMESAATDFKTTVILVTHNPQVAACGNRHFEIRDGKLTDI